ncbi:hypothetical protein [Cotesia plutellae polydnavirus]|nr:hypothetical protein [Cotesia plutellae polydnavirus]
MSSSLNLVRRCGPQMDLPHDCSSVMHRGSSLAHTRLQVKLQVPAHTVEVNTGLFQVPAPIPGNTGLSSGACPNTGNTGLSSGACPNTGNTGLSSGACPNTGNTGLLQVLVSTSSSPSWLFQ